MHLGDCVECKRLSTKLAEATKVHFSILAKMQLAQGENNTAPLSELESLKVEAAEKRGIARMELRRHEADSSPGEPADGVDWT